MDGLTIKSKWRLRYLCSLSRNASKVFSSFSFTIGKGRKDLVDACPYGHIWWNEELNLPQIWTFDAHLLDNGWQQTRGEQSCPTGAMKKVKLDDVAMQKMAREEGLVVIQP